MNIIFFIRSYNDVDHMTPLLDRILFEKRHNVFVFCISQSFNYDDNHNIKYLKKKYGLIVKGLFNAKKDKFRLRFYSFILKNIETNIFLKKHLRYLHPARKKIINCLYKTMPKEYLKQIFTLKPNVLIFDWSSAYVYPQRLFVKKAKELNIPTYCLPHGILLYTNKHPTKKNTLLSKSADIFYDKYLFYGGSEQYLLDRGIPVESINLIGSMRYSEEWMSAYKDIVKDTSRPLDFMGKKDNLKLVFFLSQNIYNVDEEKLMATLLMLSKLEGISVIIKPHTRGMSTEFMENLGFYIDENTSSVTLSGWCDCAILYGSSIGLQILFDKKILLYPNYIDTNSTIFDQHGACIKVESADELKSVVESIADGLDFPMYSTSNVESLFSEVVYAGNPRKGVITDYLDYIERYKN